MDSSVSQSILSSSSPSISYSSSKNSIFSDYSVSPSNEGWDFKNLSFTSWILIILILAFLGFNVFVYLAKGTDAITQIFSPIIDYFFGGSVIVGSQIVDVSAEGAKKLVNETAGAAENTLTAIQNVTPDSTVRGSQYKPPAEDPVQNTPINQYVNHNQQLQRETTYDADNADSAIQGGGKSGWCYIGQDRGVRSCAEINASDGCMSGNIFPTHDLCINPSIRR
jgi:hypothetical protein